MQSLRRSGLELEVARDLNNFQHNDDQIITDTYITDICLFVCLFKFSTPNSGEKAAQFPFCAGEDLVED